MGTSPTAHMDSKMQQQQRKHYFFGNLPQNLLMLCNKTNKDETDSHNTLLSDQGDDSGECEEEAQRAPVSSRTNGLSQKWKAMEKRFSDRDRRFQQISDKTENAELLSLLWERERAVRKLERECLLLRHGYSKDGNEQENLFDSNNDNDDDDKSSGESDVTDESTDNESVEQKEEDEDVFYDASTDVLPDIPSMPLSFICRWFPFHRTALLELKTTVPTSVNLVFDCLFYVSGFDIIDVVMRGIAQKISKAWVGEDDTMAFAPLFIWLLSSIVILWHSGYLFWWSSQEVYSCVKFDLHNQLKLQNSRCLNFMRFIREREILCMSVYLVGYIICYTSVMMLNELLFSTLFPKTQPNTTIILYDLVTLTTSLWILKTSGFIPWKKF